MNQTDRELYTEIQLFGAKEYEKMIQVHGVKNYFSTVFELLLRLRQLCDHSFLVIARTQKSN